jgi:AcrR family transcriptional regulator
VGYNAIPKSNGRTAIEGRREVILGAACTLFEERGYYGTSLRMIATKAGITPSLLQKYFPTKQDVLSAFVEQALDELDRFTTAIQKAIATTPDVCMLLRMIALSYVAFVERERGFYLTWIMNPETMSPYRESLPEFVTFNHKILASVLSHRLGIPEDEAFVRVRMFFGSLFAWVIFYGRVAADDAQRELPTQRVDRLIAALIADCPTALLSPHAPPALKSE